MTHRAHSAISSARVLRAGAWLAWPVAPRALAWAALLLVLACALLVTALLTGEPALSWQALGRTLLGAGGAVDRWLVHTVRLPRVLTALGAGAALGLSGALFQSLTRNPLGSPDVIGLTAGASAGAVAVAMVWPGLMPVAWGAAAGALLATAGVWFGSGAGFAAPQRMVIAGIAVGAIAFAFVQYGLSNLRREQAYLAAAWLNGSLAGRTWTDVSLIAGACAVLLPLALALCARLRLLEMGDDLAQALGATASRSRLAATLVAVLAAAAAVTVAGPVAFIALSAPQIARRCVRASGPQPLLAALTGAVLLAAADLLTRAAGPNGLPVGVLTAGIGGVYLAFLLVLEWRKTST
ncbi:iron chelate uptake ABC transporter family permease subunit [Achromobacter xylosoxidans]|uniref:FecCD family ABC transporter permease n=1 Tax=Alcaligenes xylosoxydans xylosoxydans TaxID=85698 RepID=UPI001232662E|nr:iron chelate uptake ABC transporter family permease subunit [Achromobacter xylosoxidans]KAA5925128.1 iron chelate uptake ABC transporter family permease subunit [Achromobacter xylosoxidans]MBK1980186.1 iron chelate uptake ABC transporter family permease subunit [Achromobacter xylosoxidans]QKI73250.1 iron chelate uptake ABC transporter family permease subunit [Achromobacter xylosoxidans]WOB76913.1 iron chelate uptake ABC transporter family permease subunit [Achromobacter xylosoxidans]